MVLSRGRQFQSLRGAKSHGVSLRVTVAPAGIRATSIEVPCAQGEPTWDAPLAPLDVPDVCVQVRMCVGSCGPVAVVHHYLCELVCHVNGLGWRWGCEPVRRKSCPSCLGLTSCL
jgi:hypothetical protein